MSAGTRVGIGVRAALGALLLALLSGTLPAGAQEARIRDVTLAPGDMPVRLVGYGLVVGLEGTGDRVTGRAGSGHTVRSVANLLRRFDVEVPEDMLRTRNVAAVLVTAEVSPYLRPGGRFELAVSSVGDASSLRGGVLWMTPLVASAGGDPLATAQGSLVLSGGDPTTWAAERRGVETTARIPDGGVLARPLPGGGAFGQETVLLLRRPDLTLATRVAAAVNASLGDGVAAVQDPGAVALTLPDGADDLATTLAAIGELSIETPSLARVVVDARDGTVVAGGDLTVGPAVVSHGTLTLAIGDGGESEVPGDLRVASGATVQEVAAALHAVGAAPSSVAAVFEALESVGALSAQVTAR